MADNMLSDFVNAGTSYLAANNAIDQQRYIADQNIAAAREAAQLASFKPVGVTSRFGTSGFQYDPYGRLIGAGYQVAPDIAAQREQMLGLAGGSLGQVQQAQQQAAPISLAAKGLFDLGQQYIAQSPQAASADWMKAQQNLLAPGREQQLAQVRNNLFQSGRSGLATGATQAGGLAATNPEMAAYYNAMAQQDAQLAAQAQQQGQQQTAFGAGLFNTGAGLMGQGYGLQTAAMNPWQSYLAGANTLEGLGQNALTMGAGLGSSAAQAGAQAGAQLMRGQTLASYPQETAAKIQSGAVTSAAGTVSPYLTSALKSLFGTQPYTGGLAGSGGDADAQPGGFYGIPQIPIPNYITSWDDQ